MKYYSFSFVRNPYDRAVSDYKWQKNVRKQNYNFRTYLKNAYKICNQYESSKKINYENCHYVPQTWYLFNEENRSVVDFIGKYENLQADLERVISKLKINSKLLKNENRGKIMPYFFYYWDIRNYFLVKKIYKDDLKNFNYSFFKSNVLRILIKRILSKLKK